jgi:tetratricopeptide (TPR) repeat protein
MDSKESAEQLEQYRTAAIRLYQFGRFEEAIESQNTACELTRQRFGAASREYAGAVGFLGLIYKAAQNFKRADECYQEAIDVLRSVGGEDDVDLAAHLSNLGVLYKQQGYLEKAMPLYEHALAIRRKHFPENSAEVANSLSNLGALLEAMGKQDEALPLYMSALEIARAIGEGVAPLLISCLNNLGNLYFQAGQFHLSEPLLRESLEHAARMMPAGHPKYLTMQANFGQQLVALHRYDEAVQLLTPVLPALTRLLGAGHPATQLAHAALEIANQHLGDSERPAATDSGDEDGEAGGIEIDLSGIEGPLQERVMEALNAFLETQRDDAVRQLMQAHPELRDRLSAILEQIRTARASVPVAELRRLQEEFARTEDPNERVELCRNALSLVDRKIQPALWFNLQSTLGATLLRASDGDPEERIEQAIEALRTALEVLPPAVPATQWASALSSLAMCYRARLRGDAEENLELAISAYERALLVPEHRTEPELYAAAQNNLANAYALRERGDRDENVSRAVLLFLQVLRVSRREAEPVEWAETQNNLGNAYRRFQRLNVAANRERAIHAFQEALTVRTIEAMPVKWAETKTNLGHAWRARIEGDRAENLREARGCYGDALRIWTHESAPERHEQVLELLGVACLEDRYWRQFAVGADYEPELLIPLMDEELAGLVNDYPELRQLSEARERAGTRATDSQAEREGKLGRSLSALFRIERADKRKAFLAMRPELKDANVDSLLEKIQRNSAGDGSGSEGATILGMMEERALLARWRTVGLDAALDEQCRLEALEDQADRLTRMLQTDPPSANDAPGRMRAAIDADDAVIGPLSRNGSPAVRRRYLARLRGRMDALISLVLALQKQAPEVAAFGFHLALRRKALDAELSVNQRDLAAALVDSRVVRLWGELTTLRQRIAEKILAVAEDENAATFRQSLLDLRLKEAACEFELAELTPSSRIDSRFEAVTVEAVAKTLPLGSALIEYLRVTIGAPGSGDLRYLALVLTPARADRPVIVDLGNADDIDAKIGGVRTALTSAAPADIRHFVVKSSVDSVPLGAASLALREAVFDSLRDSLDGANVIYISPDGNLSLLPFEILSDGRDHYLIDDFSFRYVVSGRDLIGSAAPQRPQAAAMVLANPDFDWPGQSGQESSTNKVFFLEDLFHFPGLASPRERPLEHPDARFAPLAGAGAEGESVGAALGVSALSGPDAVKPVLLECKSPRILHLATHGLFLEDPGTDDARGPDASRAHRLGLRLVPRHLVWASSR